METIREEGRYRKEDIACLKRWQKTPLGNLKSSEVSRLEEALFARFEHRVREERISPATNHSDLCVLERAIKWQKRLGVSFCRFITDEVKSDLWETGLTGKYLLGFLGTDIKVIPANILQRDKRLLILCK